MKHFIRVLLASLATLALVACGEALPPDAGTATPEAVGEDGVQRLTLLVSNEMRFSPSAVAVKAGQPVELTLRSVGMPPHDFTLTDGVGSPVQVAVDGGQRTATATFTLERAGTYQFICSVPGHADGGMRGTIVAQ